MGHHKAASCSALPSFQSFTSISTSTTQTPSLFDQHQQLQQTNLKRSAPTISKTNSQQSDDSIDPLFPLPSFCLYSKRALTNEYGPEADIIQFLSPSSDVLEERLPMFVGVLQSLFTVINDMPFANDSDCEDEEEEDEYDDDEEEMDVIDRINKLSLEEEEEEIPFAIIGLSTMKLVVWNNMCDNKVDDLDIYKDDLCLVVMVSSRISDDTILENMGLLRNSIMTYISSTSNTATPNEMGEQLIPLIEYWFDLQL